jgi:hypothetical protein
MPPEPKTKSIGVMCDIWKCDPEKREEETSLGAVEEEEEDSEEEVDEEYSEADSDEDYIPDEDETDMEEDEGVEEGLVYSCCHCTFSRLIQEIFLLQNQLTSMLSTTSWTSSCCCHC